MTIRDDILAGGFDLENRDDAAIAASLSVGRTRLVTTMIGYGTVLDVLGLEAGNALLDVLHSDPRFKYVVPMLEQGRLDISMSSVRSWLDQLSTVGVLTSAHAQALKALAEAPDPIPVTDVSRAINDIQGIPT